MIDNLPAEPPDDPDDQDVYRIDLVEAGTSRVAFDRDTEDAISALSLELMPLRLERQPARTNPRRWMTGLLALLFIVAGLGLGWILRRR